MARTMVVCVALTLLTAMGGCRICSSPYDYCRPTFTGECGQDCCSTGRAGSFFSDHMAPFPDDGYLLDDGYVSPDEFSLHEELDAAVVAEVDTEGTDEVGSDEMEVADAGTTEAMESGGIEKLEPDAVEEVDFGVILSVAEEELEESPEDDLPLLRPPQVTEKVSKLPSDGWKAVKRGRSRWQ